MEKFPKFDKRDVPNKGVMVGKTSLNLINVQHVYWEHTYIEGQNRVSFIEKDFLGSAGPGFEKSRSDFKNTKCEKLSQTN